MIPGGDIIIIFHVTYPTPQNDHSPHLIFESLFLAQFLTESLKTLHIVLCIYILDAPTLLLPKSIFLIFQFSPLLLKITK